MLQRFYPREYRDSAYMIDYAAFWDKGYRGILFDIDNTLVPHDAPATDKPRELFQHLKAMGFHVCLVSNNQDARVKPFAEAVGAEYVCKAGKPSRKGYLQAMKVMETRTDNTLLVGDQIFTDIWGANRAGIYSVLTRPINSKEEIQIVLKRIPEKFILFCYQRKK